MPPDFGPLFTLLYVLVGIVIVLGIALALVAVLL